ncbi:hypothetical protein FRB93_005969 [Tulasnella sp. JGI-2019a]|nr:hypothetical protein FRB93_005969 [Tulasnella sp. JGI-2019a]
MESKLRRSYDVVRASTGHRGEARPTVVSVSIPIVPDRPIAGGGYCDLYKVPERGGYVAMKRPRFSTEETTEAERKALYVSNVASSIVIPKHTS